MIDYGDMLRLVMRPDRNRREVEQMFSRCVFNVVFNNRDDHLRNFAFRMQRDGEWRLSPAFDLTFSEGFGGQHWNSVMTKGAQITRDDLLSVAQMGGLKTAAAKRAISQVLDSLPSWSRLSKSLPMTRETRRKVHERVLANARRC
ncbi:MAG: HipA domain-containing protein [Steroidobacteraceae bacterium]